MKRTALALILVLLFSELAGILLINAGIANPTNWGTTVMLLSPENKTYAQNTISIAFKYDEQMKCNPYYKYILDGNESELLLADFDGSVNHASITGLSDGAHTLIIHVMANSGSPPPASWSLDWYSGYSKTAIFIIDTIPPSIELLSPENKTYNTSEVPLNFNVNEAFSKITYSLDGQDNVTVVGNTILTGLPYGEHNVRVYVTDEARHTGTSETIYFSLAKPEPFTATLIVAVTVIVAVIGTGLLVYFKRRNHLH